MRERPVLSFGLLKASIKSKIIIRSYETLNNFIQLDPYWVTGFCDGEGYFYLFKLINFNGLYIKKNQINWLKKINFFYILILLIFISFSVDFYNGDFIILSVLPIITYANADIQKTDILKNNNNKSGVYRWTNLLNGKSYIGSSVNLGRRLRDYFNISYLEMEIEKNSSIIYKALLKYGYSNFSLEILEYCNPENNIEKEQYYIDLLNPEYNILKSAASSLGHKHSQETLQKMSNSQKAVDRLGIKNPRFGKLKPEGSGKPFQKIAVLDLETNLRTEYDSIAAAAEAIGIKKSIISVYLFNNQKKPYKKRYVFEKI